MYQRIWGTKGSGLTHTQFTLQSLNTQTLRPHKHLALKSTAGVNIIRLKEDPFRSAPNFRNCHTCERFFNKTPSRDDVEIVRFTAALLPTDLSRDYPGIASSAVKCAGKWKMSDKSNCNGPMAR